MRPEPPPAELPTLVTTLYTAWISSPLIVYSGRRCRPDDPELRSTIQTAPQVISGKAGLDALLDPNAVRRERDRVAVVADQCVDIRLGRGDAIVVGSRP